MQGRFPTGVDRVSLEYVNYFGPRSSGLIRYAGQWLELSKKDSEQVFEALLAPNEAFNYLIRQVVVRALLTCLYLDAKGLRYYSILGIVV